MSVDGFIRQFRAWEPFFAATSKLPSSAPGGAPDKGKVFERLTQLYLKTSPEYQSKLRHVWRREGGTPARRRGRGSACPPATRASTSSPRPSTASSGRSNASSGRTPSRPDRRRVGDLRQPHLQRLPRHLPRRRRAHLLRSPSTSASSSPQHDRDRPGPLARPGRRGLGAIHAATTRRPYRHQSRETRGRISGPRSGRARTLRAAETPRPDDHAVRHRQEPDGLLDRPGTEGAIDPRRRPQPRPHQAEPPRLDAGVPGARRGPRMAVRAAATRRPASSSGTSSSARSTNSGVDATTDPDRDRPVPAAKNGGGGSSSRPTRAAHVLAKAATEGALPVRPGDPGRGAPDRRLAGEGVRHLLCDENIGSSDGCS